jgi:uncharacterized protein with HEPN domain
MSIYSTSLMKRPTSSGKQLPDGLRQKYGVIEWRAMAGMRERLIHNYFGVDYDIVWDVAINKIPALDAEIRLILKQEYP